MSYGGGNYRYSPLSKYASTHGLSSPGYSSVSGSSGSYGASTGPYGSSSGTYGSSTGPYAASTGPYGSYSGGLQSNPYVSPYSTTPLTSGYGSSGLGSGYSSRSGSTSSLSSIGSLGSTSSYPGTTSNIPYRVNTHNNRKSYRKVPKFSGARKLCCNLPKIQTMRPNLRFFPQTDANGTANSEDPDQTAPLGAV